MDSPADPRGRALKEAIERETATAEILQIIASSPADTQPVFDAIVRSGLRLFADAAISIALPDGDKIRAAAVAEHDAARAEAWRNRFPFPLRRDYMHGIAILDAKILDIADVADAPPEVAPGAQNFLASGYRAITIMPMMHGDAAIGALSVVRRAVGPLSDEQLAVLRTFAAQAVIAIENTRLVNALRQRTGDLTESLEQQGAASEVLKVIGSSPGELEPVFQAMLENATRICQAIYGALFLYENGLVRVASHLRTPDALADYFRQRGALPLDPATPVGHSILTRQPVHIADISTEQGLTSPAAKLGGARSYVCVPMLKDDEAIGAIAIYRQEDRPFTDKQVGLVQIFAAQAVIAIENTRLLTELRQRTGDLSESLDQQTAISDVLRVISNSPGDVEPVFDAVARHAARICEAPFADIIVAEAGMIRNAANVGALGPMVPGIAVDRTTFMGRSICDKQTLHVADLQSPDLDFPLGRQLAIQAGARTALAVPLIRDDRALGTILVRRTEVRLFEKKHIALLKTFADQAAIAIENARLLNELRQRTGDLSESLEQQTATSEVLKVISSSPGELNPVFNVMLAKATQLCGASHGTLWLQDDDGFRAAARYGVLPAALEAKWWTGTRFQPRSDVPLARCARTRKPVHVSDMRMEQGYLDGDPWMVSGVDAVGLRSLVVVPMLKEDKLVGAIAIYRTEVRPFTHKQVELVANFAAQAVIAIENTRLLTELRQRTDDLTESLEQQTATSEVLRVISSSPGELEPVFTTMLANALRICEAKFGILLRRVDDTFRVEALQNVPPAYAEFMRGGMQPGSDTGLGRVVLTRQTVHIPDITAEAAYLERDPVRVATVELGGTRSFLAVPMLKDNELIGAIVIYRTEVRPFTDKQIDLVTNFAAQAVIAIENTRLLTEVRQQASQLEAQSQELRTLNQGLEQRVDEQVGEIERMGRLRRFLPPQVADLIVSSGSEKQLESHRREITALFCDLRGFTGFSETSDPEDVMALLREYHKAIGEIIFRHGGTLERFAGDGVMVIFNDPVPLPNPALSAVQMALEMRAAIGALIEKWRRLGHELGFGIGIAHGYATLGTIGFEGRFDYAAIGTVSNVASRLCDEAAPGQILVSPRVLLAVEDAVSVEPVREMALKGIRRPMLVHNVVGAETGKPGGG